MKDHDGMHSLLKRQVRRHLGTLEDLPESVVALLEAVDDAYRQSDEDRAMLERALEISSQELMQSNSQTRAMLEATPYLFLRVGIDGTVLDHKPGPLVDLFCFRIHPQEPGLALRPEFLQSFESAAGRLLRGEPAARFEFEPDAANGRLFEVRIVMLTSTQMVVVIQDITERRAAQAAQRESEEQFRLLAEAMPQLVWIAGPDGKHIYFNERWFDYTGLTFEESVSHWRDALHPDDRERVWRVRQEAIGRGESYVIQSRLRRRDGTYHWMLNRALPLRDPSGRVCKWLGTSTDIDELKKALEAARAAEEKLAQQAALIDEARDAMFVRDLDGRITFWNKGAERLYGWTARSAIGRKANELLNVPATTYEAATRALLQSGEWRDELDKTTAMGTVVTVDSHATLMRDQHGLPKSVFVIDSDITERKRFEQQFLRAQRLESIGTLAGGISHDLNNLLMPIVMGVGLLKRQPGLDEKVLNVIANIETSAKRGADLVRQMLSFAKGVEGSRVRVRAGDVAAEVQSIAENTFPKNVRFETGIPHDLWLILGDPTQIHQVLLNLCVNARDAMPHGGRLTISARNVELDAQYAAMNRGVTVGPYVVLTVTDTGTGMPRKVLDRIFEPFFTTKELGQGTGLGLSTALGIVRSHGGFMNVISEPGKGTAVEVYLPATPKGIPASDVKPEAASPPHGNGELVLVVDDESLILSVTSETLEDSGYRSIAASDGAEAIALYAQHRDEVAVVLTDMMMPVMDGAALIGALRRIDPEVRIVVTSGLSSNGHLAKASALGIKHILSKPYTAETMLEVLNKALKSDESLVAE